MTKSRDAIVADFAGLTRDRHYGDGRLGDREFIVIDTGGFEPDSTTGIVKEMAKQTRQAVAEADAVIFVLDVRTGLAGQDQDIGRYLRRCNKRVFIAVNKAEEHARRQLRCWPSSSEHFGMGERRIRFPPRTGRASARCSRRCWTASSAAAAEATVRTETRRVPVPDDGGSTSRSAGRPNVGKSTLINTWLGEERLVAFDVPGTTRDAISVDFEHNGQKFKLIDTAGLRRKGKVFEAIEKFSVVKTLQAIADFNVGAAADRREPRASPTRTRTAPATSWRAAARSSSRSTSGARSTATSARPSSAQIRTRLGFLRFAPILKISALKRQGLGPAVEGAGGRLFVRLPQDDDAGADAPDPGSGAASAAAALGHLASEAALRPPGRDELRRSSSSTACARRRQRRLQALSGSINLRQPELGTPMKHSSTRSSKNPCSAET